ncbi:hypothetical protein GDO86_003336 [Hymenochirus boettgeri]|uniref:Protein phosphatase 1 regulatory subunit 15A/B C-terminal domain-containing protein n=1 Tax=Hymenochirus boettgeri TaxID=247094 RepID=A0A8T2K4J5_9PIPI|nr:hypothetical protein GDO86_003336 [Hymenochirus boettgeri]
MRLMCAERKSFAPGLRAMLGRFLQGLLPYRVFQLIGAAWSHLIGFIGTSLFSFALPRWVVHKPVGAVDFPEVLEALRELGPVHWYELGECLGELGEIINPKDQGSWEPNIEILGSWGGFGLEQEKWKSKLESWKDGMVQDKIRNIWQSELNAWEERQGPIRENVVFATDSFQNENKFNYHPDPCKTAQQQGEPLPQVPVLGMVSCIIGAGSGGLFAWVAPGNEHYKRDNLESQECHKHESMLEVQHVRNKRLMFLQYDRDNGDIHDIEKDHTLELVLNGTQEETQNLAKSKLESCHRDWCQNGELLYDLHQKSILLKDDLQISQNRKEGCELSVIGNQDYKGSLHDIDLPSPDQDQGYCSIEDWQSLHLNFVSSELQNVPTAELISSCLITEVSDVMTLPCEIQKMCNFNNEVNDEQNSGEADSDLEDMPVSTRPVCANKHISYILGVPNSDEDDDLSSWTEDDHCNKDDGFDSEGSLSETDEITENLEEGDLWKFFNSPDPYNPQNFTATIHTGAAAEQSSVYVENENTQTDDDESWCDSDINASSDSEDECSVDKEENLKLWNAFVMSNDPYNLLCFKAPVNTAENKSRGSICKNKELCENPQYSKNMSPSCVEDSPLLTDSYLLPLQNSSARLKKKVTFLDKVTEYYVCIEEERKGPWEEFARDRCRFHRRIQEIEDAIGHCFTSHHRRMVWDRIAEHWNS